MRWKARTIRSTSSHSPSCTASRSCIRLAPTENWSASPLMTKASKLRTGFAIGAQGFGDHADDVFADGVLFGVQFQAGDAIAEIDQRSAGILPDHAVGERGRWPRGRRLRARRWAGRSRWRGRSTRGRDCGTRRSRRRRAGAGTLAEGDSMRATVWATPAASQSSNGPISQLKPARMARSTLAALSAISGRQSAA